MSSLLIGLKATYKHLLFLAVIFASLETLLLVKAATNQFFTINDLCSESFKNPNSRMIEGSLVTSLGERSVNCVITFQTDTILQSFMLRFERLQLDCNDHLIIYDGAYTTSPHKANLSCRNTMQNVGTIYTHSNHVTLKYVTDEYGPVTNGFRLIITAFKDQKNTCLHFRCQKTNFCVNRGLTCDSVNHCGDGSDESPSLALCPSAPLEDILGVSRTLLIVGITTFTILCFLCVVTVIVCVCRKNNPNLSHLQQQQQQQQQHHQNYQMDMNTNYGTNGTFGSVVSDKPPPYPGALQHTVVIPPGTSPGNPVRPVSGVGCSTLQPPKAPTGLCGRRVG